MSRSSAPESLRDDLRRLAGYLNFSSGDPDVATLAAANRIYGVATDGRPLRGLPAWIVVRDWIQSSLDDLVQSDAGFADVDRAKDVLELTWSELLPAYLDCHKDLLFHQAPELVFNGFFLVSAAGAVLSTAAQMGLADSLGRETLRRDYGQRQRIVAGAIEQMDDYVGYRPVATLENHDGNPYRHEFVCPIALYVKDAGVSAGPYQEILTLAIEALRQTDPDILQAASFDVGRMEVLALDPRAYDFDHPVNRRPNYHFGGWDERRVDNDGYFTRFIVRDVTLDSLLRRTSEDSSVPANEAIVEAASVLAGTILMASGVSGWGPGAYSGDVTLGSLMKPIAKYRDEYYEDRLGKIDAAHAARLRAEATRRHQPFGGVRQHLNAALARRRASQLQHVQLARLYARMGYPKPAKKQSDEVAAASARLMCRIDCLLTSGLRAIRVGDLKQAAEVPEQAYELMLRGIECGAFVDPWDILGFGGNFSLYAGPESSVHDSRIDDFLYLLEQLFGYIAKVWSEAAARDDHATYNAMETTYGRVAQWWRQFAAHTVESLEATDPLESYDSARLVARALRYWHQGGAASGDIKFWAGHAEWFDSPRAYALVISALLQRGDFVSSMALLVHWMNGVDRVGLRSGGSSLPRLSERWLLHLRNDDADKPAGETWRLAKRFFDHLEANAEEFWSAPKFQIGDTKQSPRDESQWAETIAEVDDSFVDEEGDLFDAAYEGMTYQDSTDDGNDGEIFDTSDQGSRDELEAESKRLAEHLSFLQSLARMWAVAADIAADDIASGGDASGGNASGGDAERQSRLETLGSWADRARENRIGLLDLLEAVRGYQVAAAGSDKDSMRSYDRLRVLRDSLMERIIGTAVEMADARRLIVAVMWAMMPADRRDEVLPASPPSDQNPSLDDVDALRLLGGVVAGDRDLVSEMFPAFVDATLPKSLLYIPLSRGGDPVKIFVARLRQRLFWHLLNWLPRRGLIAEGCRLAEAARQMEQSNPIGIGAVTEFDSLFKAGFQSLVGSLVHSAIGEAKEKTATGTLPSDIEEASKTPEATSPATSSTTAEVLVPQLERLTEVMLASWLSHSQTLRLSPLEMVTDDRNWKRLVEFIQAYGDPIFTQTFLQLGNVRAILHQGVFDWLQRVVEASDPEWSDTALVQDIESGKLSLGDAERWITLVYESLIDHHAEYLDYNSTTTQSDRGDLVYMFLDFLRLRVRYDRIAWNLKPVMWAHEVLVREGLDRASQMWRQSLSDRIGKEAEIYVKRLRRLQNQYAMRMPTVADRIMESFIQPMTIDRIRALVEPAMQDAEDNRGHSRAFERLHSEVELLTRTPSGVGLDLPAWLDSLEEEVETIAKAKVGSEIDPSKLLSIDIRRLSSDDWNDQLGRARAQGRRLPHMDDG